MEKENVLAKKLRSREDSRLHFFTWKTAMHSGCGRLKGGKWKACLKKTALDGKMENKNN
ncbi:hypothetical protein HMPREF3293_01943 [Christensenella minuta]|uniref:Uncharacterized protein n=1 Tax=Christensenella minuta TaxID=626937 RepID=A0A136Q3T3_9FIRM|nr:hypothetical protein HMPREF3293_01943 [Christensenella minuta]